MKPFRFTPGDPRDGRDEPAPEALIAGAAQFNAQAWFACHETLEALWLAERRAVRDLYKGVIQVAAAFFHLGRRERKGALALLPRGVVYVSRFGPVCQGLDAAGLAAGAAEALAFLTLHPDVWDVPPQWVPKISLTSCRPSAGPGRPGRSPGAGG